MSNRQHPGGPPTQIFTMAPDGSDVRMVPSQFSFRVGVVGAPSYPVWSPNRSELALGISPPLVPPYCPSGEVVAVVGADGSGLRQVNPTRCNRADGEPTWSPDGTHIVHSETDTASSYYESSELRIISVDGNSDRQLTAPAARPNCNQQTRCPYRQGDHEPSFSPDGKQIVFTRVLLGESGLYVVDVATGSVHLLFRDDFNCLIQPISHPSWSPDGSSIVFTRYPDGPSTSDIYVIRTDGTGLTRLTVHQPYQEGADSSTQDCNAEAAHGGQPYPEENLSPSWSPDGTEIVFVSTRAHVGDCDPSSEIFIMDRNGANQRRLTTHPAVSGSECGSGYGYVTDSQPDW